MNIKTVDKDIQKNIQICVYLLFISCLFSCNKEPENSIKISPEVFNAIPDSLPPPINAHYLDPDSLLPPTTIALRKQPKKILAHPNVHMVGTPSEVQIPKDPRITTFGENGVPFPITVPVNTTIVPVSHPKPVLALAPAYKDDATYNINYLSDKQGMQFGGSSLLEDSRGSFWFGGAPGVVRYDGDNFFHYTKKEGFPEGVKSLIEDGKGNIWMGSKEGLHMYDGRHLTHYTLQEIESNNGLELSSCNSLMEDSNGNLWFSNSGNETSSKGAYYFDGSNFIFFGFKYWNYINQKTTALTYPWDYDVSTIFEDSHGQVWLATKGSGIIRFDGLRLIHYTMNEGLIDDHISTIQEDKGGNIWFGSYGDNRNNSEKGLSCYKPALDYPSGTGGKFTNFTLENGLSDNNITGIIEARSGHLWFSTFRGGINSYDGKTFTHFKEEQGLNSVAINIIQDNYGNIWTTSVGNNAIGGAISDIQINRFQPNSFTHYMEKQGISKPSVSAVEEDSKGNIWLGTLGGGVIKYDGHFFTNFTIEQGLCGNGIYSILEDREGNMWFASTNNGVSRFDGNVFTNFALGQGMTYNLVWDIFEDFSGNLWFACATQGGVVRLDPKTGIFTQFDDDAIFGKENIGLGSASFHEDKQHNLWVGGTGWMLKHNPVQDQMEIMYLIDPDTKGWMELMLEDDKGDLWFGTEDRLVKVNKKVSDEELKFTLFTKENGLPDAKIQTMIEDKQKNVWLSTDKGLALMVGGFENIGKKEWIQYGIRDGLKSNGYIANSAYLDSRNRMWWGTGISGVTMLDLNTFPIPTKAPKNVNLSYIEVNQEFIDFGNFDNLTNTTLAFDKTLLQDFDSVASFYNYPTHLKLPYDINHLTFHFSAIDWSAPHKIQYSYKMEGLDKDWSHVLSKTEAEYRNLPFGTFTFKVKAIGEAQVWSEPFKYTFSIRPPWWHTWWAYLLFTLAAVYLLRTYILSRSRKLVLANKLLEEKVSKRTKKLSLKTNELESSLEELKSTQAQLIQSEKMASLGELTAGIAHEIQNPLNFVNNFSELNQELVDELKEELDKGDIEEARAIAKDIKANESKINHHGKRADAIVKGMLQHSRKSTAEKEPTDINKLADEYLRLAYHGLRAKDKTFNAQLDTDFDENIDLIKIIPQDIGRVILNLITNAFYAVNEKKNAAKGSGFKPTVSVSTKKLKDKVLISVKDNGNGIPKEVVDKIFQPFFTTKPTGEGTGLGLSMSYDIVTKGHGGELKVETKEGEGSEFIIRLPA